MIQKKLLLLSVLCLVGCGAAEEWNPLNDDKDDDKKKNDDANRFNLSQIQSTDDMLLGTDYQVKSIVIEYAGEQSSITQNFTYDAEGRVLTLETIRAGETAINGKEEFTYTAEGWLATGRSQR